MAMNAAYVHEKREPAALADSPPCYYILMLLISLYRTFFDSFV